MAKWAVTKPDLKVGGLSRGLTVLSWEGWRRCRCFLPTHPK